MTDVIVFEGRVDLHETAGAVLPRRSLTIGDAARINSIGAVDRIMEVGRDTSGGWWTTRPSSARLIASVKDNIVSDVSDMFTCYQTTAGSTMMRWPTPTMPTINGMACRTKGCPNSFAARTISRHLTTIATVRTSS